MKSEPKVVPVVEALFQEIEAKIRATVMAIEQEGSSGHTGYANGGAD